MFCTSLTKAVKALLKYAYSAYGFVMPFSFTVLIFSKMPPA